VRYGDDSQSIWVIDSRGGRARRVSLDFGGIALVTGDVCCPEWSPRGQRIAASVGGDNDLIRFFRPGDDVVVGRIGRSDWRSVAAGYDPSWSPDGRRLVFGSARSGDWELYVVGATGGTPRRITRLDGFDGSADWSPDGESILFEHAFRDGTVGIMVVPVTGGPAKLVSIADGVAVAPSWQPLP
jgi:TolB protein